MQKLKLINLVECALLQTGHSSSELSTHNIGELYIVWDNEYEVLHLAYCSSKTMSVTNQNGVVKFLAIEDGELSNYEREYDNAVLATPSLCTLLGIPRKYNDFVKEKSNATND